MKKLSTTKRHQVARLLEKAILTGQLKPGARLREMKLASELNVSQACIREALQELEGLGFVVKYPNRGSFVMNLTNQDLLQIYQVRRQLEPLACALTAQFGQEKLETVEKCLREMQVTAKNRDYRAYVDADFRFHRLIWESQPNRCLERSLKDVCLALWAGDLVRRRSAAGYDFDRAVRQHQLILSSLRSGDASLAARVMQRTLDRFLRQDLSDYYQLAKIVDKADGSKDRLIASLGDAVPML